MIPRNRTSQVPDVLNIVSPDCSDESSDEDDDDIPIPRLEGPEDFSDTDDDDSSDSSDAGDYGIETNMTASAASA